MCGLIPAKDGRRIKVPLRRVRESGETKNNGNYNTMKDWWNATYTLQLILFRFIFRLVFLLLLWRINLPSPFSRLLYFRLSARSFHRETFLFAFFLIPLTLFPSNRKQTLREIFFLFFFFSLSPLFWTKPTTTTTLLTTNELEFIAPLSKSALVTCFYGIMKTCISISLPDSMNTISCYLSAEPLFFVQSYVGHLSGKWG